MSDTYTLNQWRQVEEIHNENHSNQAVCKLAKIATDLATYIAENETLLRHHRIAAESYRAIPVTEGPQPAKEFFNPRLCRKLRPVTVIECHPHTAQEKDWPMTRLWRGEPETGQGRAVRVKRGSYGARREMRRAA